jgi:hypothetical protein
MRKFMIERKNNGNYSKKNGYRNMDKEKYTADVCI